ncbi:cytochrome P450 [Nocardioides humi]|uniref:Cytochrome P450 n=1 Tax=Nocardioides humi TaxID=449461 RepID=A0ABN2BJ83_9ACTN|nr:cytochrome P450 [Nocardioides humi]
MTISPPTGCPVNHTDFTPAKPALSYWKLLDDLREEAPIMWNDAHGVGFWMVQRHDQVLEVMQQPKLFSNDVIQAINPREDAIYFLPNMLNAPEHNDMRRLLNRWFSPAAVRKAEPLMVERANSLIDELIGEGRHEMMTGFAMRYPTDLLLQILGMPVEDGPQMVQWVEAIFGGAFGGEGGHAAVDKIKAYFAPAFEERRKNPGDPETDFLTYLLQTPMGDSLLSDEDLLTVCMTMMTAGLDTTRSALGYIFRDLALNDDHRTYVIENTDRLPDVVEEFVRLHNLIMQPGREVTEDVDFHGVHMKKGDVVWIGIAQACRDPREFADPTTFDPDRDNLGKHLGWGAGGHRCIGMHLARHEIVVALREWHKRIPDYRVVDPDGLMERGVQLSLQSMELEWDRR